MNRSRLLGTVFVCAFSIISMSSRAALVDNGGGLIYDTVLDITWAQPDGPRSWDDAKTWAAGLTLGGVDGWRLPYISVAAGAGPLTGGPVDCSTATEIACRDNELGYMFYHNLSGTRNQSILTSGDPDLALFPTLQNDFYMSGTAGESIFVWDFLFFYGLNQTRLNSGGDFSWAVHAGNVGAVPVPAAMCLFGSGLLGLIGVARKNKTV
jgi:hypothetical protein